MFRLYRRQTKIQQQSENDHGDDSSIRLLEIVDEAQFIPFVSNEKADEVYTLASLPLIDRAAFFAENVSQGRGLSSA